MNTKATALLLAAAAALFAFIYYVERPLRLAALVPPNQRVLPNLDPAKITSVQIQVAGGVRTIRADKTNQLWQLTQPQAYPASGALIDRFLQLLAQWDWQSSIDHPESWDQYGLVRDQFTLLLNQEDGEQRILKIGQLAPAGDQVYLNVRGSAQILVASPELLSLIPSNQFQWRDLTVLDLDRVPFLQLKVHSTNWDFVLERPTTNGLWKMTKPIEARADTPKINEWLAQLQALRVQGFPPDDARGPDTSATAGPTPNLQLDLTFLRDPGETTNKVLELQVVNSPPGRTNRALARRLSPSGLIEIDSAPLVPWEGDWINFLDRHLLGFSPGLIGSIAVSGAGLEKFTVQKTAGGSWRVNCADGDTFPADELLMKEWFFELTNIQVVIPRSPTADKSLFGLDNPAGPLLRYQLFCAPAAGQTNPLMADLLFGRGTNQPPKIYEMGGDEKYVNSIDPQQFDLLPNACWELRDLAIWHFQTNQVVAIDIHQLGADLRYTRDTNNQWVAPRGYLVTPVQPAIEETLYQMGQLHAIYWSGCGDDHLERFGFDQADYRISFEINNNGRIETNTIQFGKPASPLPHPYASIMRDGRRLIFEFPVSIYSNLVAGYLGIPEAYHRVQ